MYTPQLNVTDQMVIYLGQKINIRKDRVADSKEDKKQAKYILISLCKNGCAYESKHRACSNNKKCVK